jgi:predicted CxxxxCH...CXXCH cytochrome family protein
MRAPFVVAFALAACAEPRERPDGGSPTISVHPPGILDPGSADFHARELERRSWDYSVCARCHGDDFAGGTAGKPCLTCHAAGPTACVTCHGAGPTSDAHVVHREVGELACGECHVVPATWDAEGHLRRDGAADPPPAEVAFGARAALTLTAADRAGPPRFADGACSNVYCHGAVLHAAGGSATRPRWDDPAPAGACDRCHGAPPPSHAQTRCATCHPTTAPHIDGVVQLGRGPGCTGCHGDASSPAPPGDLAGNLITTAIGVGAHRAHLTAPSGLRGPIGCDTCHLVPRDTGDAGHIDTPLPAEVSPGLGWDRTRQTCATSVCHGAARPVWTTRGAAACGTCHGIPPATASHTAGMTLASCTTCHPQTVDALGRILLTPGPGGVTSTHMNGASDVP